MATTKTTKKTTSRTSVSTSKKKKMTVADLKNKILAKENRKTTFVIAGIVVLGILLFLGRSLFVAATVNGQPISRMLVIKELEAQNGKATLDRIITKKLVMQEAAKKKITVSNADIDKEIAKIDKQFKDQGQDLNQLLETQGISKQQFREEVEIQLLVEKMLGDQAKVTDAEFNAFLEQNKDLLANEKDQNAAKAQYRTQLEQQKLAQKYQEWVVTLKKDAKIQHLVNY